MTLIGKLEQRKQDFEPRFASDFWILEGLDKAINIVKEHNEWISTNEQLPYAEEMLTNHYNPKEFYEIILKTGELLITSFTHMKNDGNNEILFLDCNIALTDGEWELLGDGYNGKVYKFECVWQGEVKTNFASGRKQATHNAVEKLFKVVGL